MVDCAVASFYGAKRRTGSYFFNRPLSIDIHQLAHGGLAIDNRQSKIVNPEIRIFDGLEPLSWAAATRLEEQARVKAIEKKPFSVALSGGSTPKLLYELLGSPTFAGRVRWPNVHLFQVDERCVPPDDPQSNYRMIRQALLESAPLPEENFHRMAAERPDREQAARDYAEELARVLRPAPGEWPRLDLVFLGMGPDGHTASLFPGSQALGERTAWVVPNLLPHSLLSPDPDFAGAQRRSSCYLFGGGSG